MGIAAGLLALVMSSSFFNPSFAFSSHFDPDGAPLSELSWSSSLAVVAVSFSGLFTFIFLMLACLCCKKGDVGFKEFDNAEGEEFPAEFSAQASPAAQNGPEVYILPLTEVSLPMSKQPGRSVQLLKSADLGRHSLLYLKEIGQGWFGKVLLGEVNAGLSSTQVVVKELKVSASVQDQMQFLEETQPYRALQHPNLLQCLAQCAEVTPYLLVMEFCPLGDVKSYLRNCRAADPMALDPQILQRMACEISCGLQHLHKNSYVHSDLALRNCLLTADLTVKIGDYGLSQGKFKEDYFVTADQLWVPLRWTAPELIDEVHGNLLVVDQTKASNIWSLGVTVWELFELGSLPYQHYSDKQVLTYTIKEEQLKLPKPQLKLSLSDRWYEVMQFCWLQAEQRPTAEEVHLLLSYLCVKGTTEAEEEFEKRWNSMKPHASISHHSTQVSSSFPLLAHFSGDAFHTDGDDILTVTETSRGLNFEYKWEPAKSEHFQGVAAGGALSPGNVHYQDMYCSGGRLSLGVSPTCYECKPDCQSSHTPGVVPVLSAHSPSVSSEYYIRIEEPSDCHADLDYTMCSYSPEYNRISPNKGPGWQEKDTGHLYDSDNSPTVSLTMEPLLGQDPPASNTWENSDYYPAYKHRSKDLTYYDQCPSDGADQCLLEDHSERREEWKVPGCKKSLFEDPLGVSPSLNCLYRDPGSYEDQQDVTFAERLMELTRQKLASSRHPAKSPRADSVIVELEDEGLYGSPDYGDGEGDLFAEEAQSSRWSSNSSSNNNISSCAPQLPRDNVVTDAWCNRRVTHMRGVITEPFGPESWQNTDLGDALWERSGSVGDHRPVKEEKHLREDCGFRLQQGSEHEASSNKDCSPAGEREQGDSSGFSYAFEEGEKELLWDAATSHDPNLEPLDSLLCSVSQENAYSISPREPDEMEGEAGSPALMAESASMDAPLPAPTGSLDTGQSDEGMWPPQDNQVQLARSFTIPYEMVEPSVGNNDEKGVSTFIPGDLSQDDELAEAEEPSGSSPRDVPVEAGKTLISEPDGTFSSMSFNETDDCSDDDTTELTSGIFMDFSGDYPERVDTTPSFKSLQKQVGTPDSLESLDIPSTASSCDVYSPTAYNPSSQPRALDSGYDTENYESPEFVLKEPHEPRDPEAFSQVTKSSSSSTLADVDGPAGDMHMSSSFSSELHALDEKNPYRDSAYFSDYDNEGDKYLKDKEEGKGEVESLEFHGEKEEPPSFRTSKQEVEDSGSSEVIAGKTDQVPDSPGDAAIGKATIVDSETPSASATVDLNIPADVIAKIPISSSMIEGDVERGTLHTPNVLANMDSLECNKGVSTDLYLSSGTTTHTMPSRTFFLSSVELNQEERYLNGLKESGVPSHDGILFNKISPTGLCKDLPDETKMVPSQRFRVKISPLANEGLASFENGRPPEIEVDGVGRLQGDHTVLRTPLTKLSLDLSLLHGKKETRQGPVDQGDEEEEDTEDSDESDEELCCYNIQEPSEESDDELSTAPIVIAESGSARNLRSLLKMPSILPHTFCEHLDRKKKVVSFFDDVTVYLFDQESPTKELGDPDFPAAPDKSPKAIGPAHSVSDDSSDGNMSEESGGFEWDDDFPLMPVTTSFVPSATSAEHVLPSMVPAQKQVLPIHFSRFTISPTAVSRFSITHVSDSDMESAGGSSEDGERE